MPQRHDISPNEIHGELERILSSSVFSTADRMTRFLRFVVEETLEGRGDNLNEWLLGMAVYDRDRKFDPRVDSIVRVDAGCLRAKLREFYASEGVNNLIGIEIPKGSYKAVFSERMDMKELGRQLGVESFIEGSVRKIKQRIRIMVRLIDAAMGSTLGPRCTPLYRRMFSHSGKGREVHRRNTERKNWNASIR